MRLSCGAVIDRIPSVALTDEQRLHWQKWIDALESGEYIQTTFCLRDDQGFCCLGLASNLVDVEGWHREKGAHAFSFRPRNAVAGAEIARDHLVPAVRRFYGPELGPLGIHVGGRFPAGEGHTLEIQAFSLSGLNDMGATFKEIAEILRHAINGGYTMTVALVK